MEAGFEGIQDLIDPFFAFNGQERQVYISGEGYFDVKKNPEMSFVVRTNVLQIKARWEQSSIFLHIPKPKR